jgi:antitoxin ParD1/3/4
MNVSLTPELEAMVNEKVQSGLYNSASEVVREALRLLKEQDDLRRMRLEELRRDIQKGIDSLERGEGIKYSSGAELAEGIERHGRQRMETREVMIKYSE